MKWLTLTIPIWLGDPGVAQMCEQAGPHAFTHRGETRVFTVHHLSWEGVNEFCGARACIVNKKDIYVSKGVTCTRSMAHELSHGMGVRYMDWPTERGRR